MQATPVAESGRRQLGRNLGYFLMLPLTSFVLLTLITAIVVNGYEARHDGRVYTGVNVWGADLSGLAPAEAAAALAAAFPYPHEAAVTFVDQATGDRWTFTPAELGLRIDQEATLAAAMRVGRTGGPLARLQDVFAAWYYGRSVAPVIVFDEGALDAALGALAAEIDEPPTEPAFDLSAVEPAYMPGRPGRQLAVDTVRQQLLAPLGDFRAAEIQLLVHQIPPTVVDGASVAAQMQQLNAGPLYFYLEEPLDDADLGYVELPAAELARWLRVETVADGAGGQERRVFLDENAARVWLGQFQAKIARQPVRARFYFDDDTRELVLVAPHVNGRELDVEATLQNLLAHFGATDRHVPFAVRPIMPTVNAGATAAELGITELITETTTWFYGSTDARKHNIARAAANFFGVVVAPGEEFSFNRYLGTVSEADGYEEGFIIVGGQTIQGIGGGVCQVSTTIYQTAFLAGFPMVERWPHGYMVGYYNDGQGPGMDATVFSPVVDFRFLNNTPYHLLIENYYNEEFEALTFKFYSTSLDRSVVKEGPVFENVTEVPGPEQDRWEFNPDLEPGTVVQVDWATEGADVSVRRIVYNANGDLIDDDYFISRYVPIPNLFQYGPDVEPYDYSLVPDD